jgi:hypothetical protein
MAMRDTAHRFGAAMHRRAWVRRRELDTLREELHRELHEARQLHERLAELTDVVAEVLVPAADRDDARVKRALAEFSRPTF